MTAVGAWLDMMPQSLSLAPKSSLDTFGNVTYGSAVTYRCRIVGKRTQVINGEGQQVVSNQTVYLATTTAIDPQARVTLSTGDVGSTESYAVNPPILSVARYPDESGAHHSVLFL